MTESTTGNNRSPALDDAPPAHGWHNLVYAVVTLSAILGPLLIPGVTYVDLFLGIESVSVGVFMLLLLAGLFHGFLPSARHAGKSRHRRH